MKKLKNYLKRFFWLKLLKLNYNALLCHIMPRLISDEKVIRRNYKKFFGKPIDFDNPKTLSEKINWYKLYDRNPLMTQCADKVEVRKYVAEKGHPEILNEVYGVFDRVSDIDLSKLPNRFVMKASHGSHMNFIVKDKHFFDWKRNRLIMSAWLRQDGYWEQREWGYKMIPPRVTVEKYMEDDSGVLKDYRFFCFNGEPRFLQVDSGTYPDVLSRDFFDMDFNLISVTNIVRKDSGIVIEKPSKFDNMKQIACDLSAPFQFARIDLYQVNGKVFFGEITFYPRGGLMSFDPPEYDLLFGQYWN